jgi:hypothetical protein
MTLYAHQPGGCEKLLFSDMTNDDDDIAAPRKFVSDNHQHLRRVKKGLQYLGESVGTDKSTATDKLRVPVRTDGASLQSVAPSQPSRHVIK